VQILEGFVIWAGRYPVPKKAKHMESGKAFGIGTQDFETFKRLYMRLEAAVLGPCRNKHE
jgi:hypothetical protein